MKVELSKEQCINLIAYIEVNLLDIFHNDEDIYSEKCAENILAARDAMKKAVSEYERKQMDKH